MDDFETEIKIGFLEEASQLLADTEQCFLSLETNCDDPSILEKIFRLAHNLKGSAKAVGFEELSHFTHHLESLLLKIKNGELSINPSSVDLLLRCNDHVRMILEGLRGDLNARFDSTALLGEIEAMMSGQVAEPPPAAEPPPQEFEETPVAPSAAMFEDPTPAPQEASAPEAAPETAPEAVVAEINAAAAAAHDDMPPPSNVIELSAVALQEKPAAPAPAKPAAAAAAADESIRVSFARLERLLNFVGELVILQTVLREQSATSESLLLKRTVDQLGKVTKEVQDISMSLRMVPLKQTFQKMQRIVRDTARALDKKINFELIGEETEVDKTLLEKLGDPLVHMVRNAVDHGIESAEKRKAAGKAEAGSIKLAAFHRSGSLVIEIRDDGGGLDAAKLTAKAIEKGILKPGTTLSERDAHQLIFASGFSTKTEVTDVSGRGVGMDVVKTNITAMQGEIQIETEIGKGSCFRIVLPLTLAIIESMVIRCGKDDYVIPLSHVHESLRPVAGDIHFATGLGEILVLRGESIPLYRLGDILGSPNKSKTDGIAIVVRTHEKPFAVLVDDILGQQQVVIKALGKELRNIKGFSGSAILGNGRPALILELHDLVSKAKVPTQAPAAGVQKGISA